MTVTYSHMEITDGTTSVSIMSPTGAATNYRLKYGEYAPTIAERRKSKLGGITDIEDVKEEFALDIVAPLASTALGYLQRLHNLLDQADRWYNNEPGINPVFFKFQIRGSDLAAPLQAVIIGRKPGETFVTAPNDLVAVGNTYKIIGVRVMFWRRGKLLGATETQTSASANNPTIHSVTFASSVTVRSPTKIELTGFSPATSPSAGTDVIPQGFLLITNDPLKIKGTNANNGVGIPFIAINTATAGTTITEIVETANLSQSPRVLRLSLPASGYADLTWSIFTSFPPALLQRGRVSFFAALRNNNAAVTWQLIPTLASGTFNVSVQERAIEIDGTLLPRYVFLGTFITEANMVYNADDFKMYITNNSAATETLDFDAIYYIAHDETTTILSMPELSAGLLIGGGAAVLVADHRLLTKTTPFFGGEQASGVGVEPLNRTTPASYQGSPVVELDGIKASCVWLATHSTYWKAVDNNNTLIANTLKATRTLAYLSPE